VILRSVDFPDVVIWGWAPTDDQWIAAIAVLAGVAGVVLLMSAFRKARRVILGFAIAIVIALMWTRLRS
jgi:hypothetical protein